MANKTFKPKKRKSTNENTDWWDDLSDTQKNGTGRGLKEIDEGRIILHKIVKEKYDL